MSPGTSPKLDALPHHIAVLGASGNVGRLVVRHLLAYRDDVVARVVAINRRVLDDDVLVRGEPRLEQHVVDMQSPDALEAACTPILRDIDVVCATMGIGSGKGKLDDFRKVEVALPSAFARAASTAGVRRAVLLTGVGANIEATSSFLARNVAEGQFFHLKGLVEKNFTDAEFADEVRTIAFGCQPD